MQTVKVPTELFNQIVTVLAQRPYVEVGNLMDEIQKQVKIDEGEVSKVPDLKVAPDE